MKFAVRMLALVPLVWGLALLVFGVSRYRLPYENERYFDSQAGIVYHLQAAELYVISGAALSLAGLVIAYASWRLMRSRRGAQMK